MKLYKVKDNKAESINLDNFKLEKEIQNLVEENLNELFNLKFVRTEFPLKNFRMDTLCYNTDSKSFVIIEYKRDKNFSVIDQGYSYLSLMLNNKSDFILEFNESCNENLKREDVDWSQSRVIFISTGYTEYQKQSVNFKDVPFELWEIIKYENDLVGLSQHKSGSEESITTTEINGSVVNQVSKQIKVYTEEFHIQGTKSNRPAWVREIYFTIKDRILNLGDVDIKVNGNYISFRRDSPFVDIVIYNTGLYIVLNMKDGTLKDPNTMMKRFQGKGHWGNGDYYVTVDTKSDLDYLLFLIKQSFQNKMKHSL